MAGHPECPQEPGSDGAMAIYPQGSLRGQIFHRPGWQDMARTYLPPFFLLLWRKIIGLGFSIHICREAVPIEKKHVHLGFYKQVWPTLPLEPLRCGLKEISLCRTQAGWGPAENPEEKARVREMANLGAMSLGDKMDTVQFNNLSKKAPLLQPIGTKHWKLMKMIRSRW